MAFHSWLGRGRQAFNAAGPFGPRINRLALVTDAWKPQTNGVVNTLVRLVKHLESQGTEVLVVAPDAHRTRAAALVPGDPRRLRSLEGDPAHPRRSSPTRFTSPPRGRWASGRSAGCAARAALHHQLPHPLRRVPERARAGVRCEWGYQLVRWFHERAEHTLVSSHVAARRAAEQARGRAAGALAARRRRRRLPPRRTARDDVYAELPRPDLALRRAASPSRRAWRTSSSCRCRGTKVVVGDGPSREELAAQLPRRRVARLPLRRGPGGALRQRRLLRLPVAHRDLRQRASSRRWPRGCRSRRCRRPARST